MNIRKALLPFLATLVGHAMAAAKRTNTTAIDHIDNITSLRYENLTLQWGGTANNTNASPNWGQMIFQVINVYPDFLGQIAWLLLFGMPFIMMWIAHADMTAAAVVGFIIGIYVVGFLGSQYMGLGIAMMCIAVAAEIWSLLQKRG
jgi:hypothetical protein